VKVAVDWLKPIDGVVLEPREPGSIRGKGRVRYSGVL
jgi:hypothetical protein